MTELTKKCYKHRSNIIIKKNPFTQKNMSILSILCFVCFIFIEIIVLYQSFLIMTKPMTKPLTKNFLDKNIATKNR